MERINRILTWLNDNQRLAYSLIRSFLGMALFVRGWIFFTDPGAVTALAGDNALFMWYSYVTMGHLIGGFLLMMGLLTRIGALMQIPILFGAVFMVHTGQHLASPGQSLELAVMVLVLLAVFFLFGPGPFSLDTWLAGRKTGSQEAVAA